MMKFKFYYFLPLVLLSLFLSSTPGLSQVLYKATVSRLKGERISKVVSSSNQNQLVNSIYRVIKPQGNPRQNVTVSLGTVNLNTFQNLLRSKGISAKYYEYLGSSAFSKPNNWKPISISSTQFKSEFYGVVLRKPGYKETSQIPFKVTQMKNNIPTLMFDSSKVSLRDETTITLDIDAGNSGLNPSEIEELLRTKDFRLLRSTPSITSNVMSRSSCSSPVVQNGCIKGSNNADYLIKLSRN